MLEHDAERKSILFLYKKHPDVPTPHYATLGSTCFDLTFYPTTDRVNGYDVYNAPCERMVAANQGRIGVPIYPGDRLLIPTGLIAKLNVPNPRLSIRLHPRSGMALKRGLVLANAEGVVDCDYQKEIFAIIHNVSEKLEYLEVGTRVCQGEILKNRRADFRVIESPPEPYTTRDGGFGSTGV
jgi:dUTP pyrophosphatase